mgnify:CR=1 FL=1
MTVSILGCGWLGFPLAEYLVKEGYNVKGSTTSSQKISLLSHAGIEPFLIRVPDDLHDSESRSFWNTDLLVLDIPPSIRKNSTGMPYPELVSGVMNRVKKAGIPRIIFTSSTSVYPATGGVTSEDDARPGSASRPSGEAILKAEKVIMESDTEYVILRVGGLYGYDRHPVKFLSGKKGLSDPLKPINFIHRDDCIRVIHEVLRQNKKNEIYNVVSDGHPPREEFYTSAARHFDLPPPEFEYTPGKDYRVVSNMKLKKELNFIFAYPNPMDHTH